MRHKQTSLNKKYFSQGTINFVNQGETNGDPFGKALPSSNNKWNLNRSLIPDGKNR